MRLTVDGSVNGGSRDVTLSFTSWPLSGSWSRPSRNAVSVPSGHGELRAQQEAAASRLDADAGAELQQLTGLLSAAAAEPARDLDEFCRAVPVEPAPTIADVIAPPRPQWSQYAPAQPGLFGRRRYDRAVAAARAELDADLARHDQAFSSGLAELTRRHQLRTEDQRRAHAAEWEAITAGISAGDPDAVGILAAWSLRTSTALRGLIEGGRTTYDPAARELVLEIDIPDTDVIPSEQGWKYVASRTSVGPTPIRPPEAAAIYAELVAQVMLAILDACFRSCGAETVDVLSVNGHVQTINPATGRPDHPCLVTVTTDRATFEELDLGIRSSTRKRACASSAPKSHRTRTTLSTTPWLGRPSRTSTTKARAVSDDPDEPTSANYAHKPLICGED
jgi:restriction system protein